MNFRSVVVLGRAEEGADPAEKLVASEALVEHVCRGRWGDVRHPNEKELATTAILRLSLDEASAKVRTGGPKDAEADLDLPVWAGHLPLAVRPRSPVPDDRGSGADGPPAYATRYARPGWTD